MQFKLFRIHAAFVAHSKNAVCWKSALVLSKHSSRIDLSIYGLSGTSVQEKSALEISSPGEVQKCGGVELCDTYLVHLVVGSVLSTFIKILKGPCAGTTRTEV